MDKIETKRKIVTLVLTHQCNLRCTYCYEEHKDDHVMRYEQAVEILDNEFRFDDGYDEIEIDLFGGEPLLEFDLIVRLVDFVKNGCYRKPFIFFASTNGVLLTDEMKKWFVDNRDYIMLGLSLDGTREMHNLNRCGSFDKIDLDFFVKTYGIQPVKMTVSQETLPMLAEGVIFIQRSGFTVDCNLAYGIDWSDKNNRKILCDQLKKLMEFYFDNTQLEVCSMLDIKRIFMVSYSDKNKGSLRVCGSGSAMKAYDCDGESYACQFFLPLSIGEEKARKSKSIVFPKHEIPDDLADPKCKSCILRNCCMHCIGSNYAATGNIYQHDETMCELFKIQFKAIAYFALKRFQKKQIRFISELELATILKSALLIDEKVKID